jgi:hypothetical protein
VDYAGNSKKAKELQKGTGPETEKKVEKVVVGTVVVKKKSLGQKIKDVFIAVDVPSVTRYVVSEVLIPAARGMIFDASTKGVERMLYGDRAPRRGPGPSRSSNAGSPLYTNYRSAATRPPLPSRQVRPGRGDFLLETREEAETVIQSMLDIIEMYEQASVADLHELLGLPSTHTDQKWGWINLMHARVQPIREGYLLDLPQPEPIN